MVYIPLDKKGIKIIFFFFSIFFSTRTRGELSLEAPQSPASVSVKSGFAERGDWSGPTVICSNMM